MNRIRATAAVLLSLGSFSPSFAAAEAVGTIDSSGAGFFSANVVILAADRAAVRKVLQRDGLAMTDQDFTPAGTHPVIFLFGSQKDVHPVMNGKHLPSPFGDYKEFAVLIPYVHPDGTDASAAFSYMPILYLDNWRAIAAGYYYGMNKEHARFSLKGGYAQKDNAAVLTYEIASSIQGRPLVSGLFKERRDYDSGTVDRHFARIKAAMGLPLINRRLGKFVCGTQTWNYDSMSIVPYQSLIRTSVHFLGGALPETAATHALDEAPLGSYRMQGSWTMTPPMDCGILQ